MKIAHTLKVIASLGISVITVIHQPRTEIFDTFDDVILLVPGGRLAYLGEKDKVQSYFESLGYDVESFLHSKIELGKLISVVSSSLTESTQQMS